MSAEGTTRSGTGLIGQVLSSRYRLESKLGSGGMSTVYLALDETLQRKVAAKVLHREMGDQPDQLERFRREARAVAQISHPNVVAVIDAGNDEDGHPYIVFEYVEGETLKQRIDRLGRLPLDEAAAYAIEVGRGLQAAHEAHMVHRDVKPQNVLIDTEGRAKVTDFGIALSKQDDGLTKTGRVLGTTDYVSPEQAMGKPVDARSDIYSLGILLFEMLRGDVPFKAETLVGVAMKHVNDPMPNIQASRPGTSAALSAVIERATQKEPNKRYRTMAEMLSDLEAALEVEIARAGGATGEATTVLASVPSKQRILSPRSVSIVGILLVLAGVLVALALVELGGESDKPPTQIEGSESTAPEGGAEIALSNPVDYDPEGDDAEHPEAVDLAIDGDPATFWLTESYNASPVLADAATKEGVGLIVETGEAVAARQIEIETPDPGWTGEIYGIDAESPDSIEEWGEPLSATPFETEEKTSIPLNDENESDRYLIWITELTENDEGTFFATIGEVKLFD
ncbi:MAG: protein kinase [Actinomycetota bacterium]|nr:protein kinase [Actinomycetota bacterium]